MTDGAATSTREPHAPASAPARLLAQARTLGFGTVVVAAAFRRLARIGVHINLVELGDDDPAIALPQLPPGYATRPVELQDLWPWVGRVEGLNAEFLEGAIARGDRCVANFYHDQLVGYGFVTRTRAPVTDQIDLTIDDWLIYRYKGWTDPRHRRRHLSHARGRLNRRLFPLQPGMRTVSIVALHNLPSKLKHADVHPIRVGYCGHVRVLGRDYAFTSRTARRFGLRLVPRQG